MSSLKKHVIAPEKPLRAKLITLLIAALPAVAVWFYFTEISTVTTDALTKIEREQSILLTENASLLKERDQLSDELTQQQFYLATEKATDQQLQTRLDELQTKVVELQKELLFYQNITQATTSSKLQIRSINLTPSINDDTVKYRVVISQGQKITTPLTGKVVISLTSKEQPSISQEHVLNLRHIQVFDGSLTLNEATTPQNITVTVMDKSKTLTTKTFDWKTLQTP
jgi:TolA-binding protein